MTVGLDDATVENVLGSGLLQCPVIGCGEHSGHLRADQKQPFLIRL